MKNIHGTKKTKKTIGNTEEKKLIKKSERRKPIAC
jgi:hypothetical protein